MTPDQTFGRQQPKIDRARKSPERRERITIKSGADSIASEKHPKRNEDSVLVSPEDKTFGIFDGVGGQEDGQLASNTARDYVLNHIEEVVDGTSADEAIDNFKRVFVGADQTIQDLRAEKNGSNMATTGVVLKIHTDAENISRALIGNVGDSRVYKIKRNGLIIQVTEDDDILNSSRMSITDKAGIRESLETAKTELEVGKDALPYFNSQFLGRHNIGKCIGGGDSAKISSIKVKAGDRFLITSDGIHDNLTRDEIEKIISESPDLETAAKTLTERSRERAREDKTVSIRAKKDDMSAIVVEVSTENIPNQSSGEMPLEQRDVIIDGATYRIFETPNQDNKFKYVLRLLGKSEFMAMTSDDLQNLLETGEATLLPEEIINDTEIPEPTTITNDQSPIDMADGWNSFGEEVKQEDLDQLNEEELLAFKALVDEIDALPTMEEKKRVLAKKQNEERAERLRMIPEAEEERRASITLDINDKYSAVESITGLN